MNQTLLNLMNSPLAITAIILWLLLFILAVKTCRKWAKESRLEKILKKNHPSIPVKKYELSEFEVGDEEEDVMSVSSLQHQMLSPAQRLKQLETLQHAWDD